MGEGSEALILGFPFRGGGGIVRVLSSVWRSLESPEIAESRPGRTMVGKNLREEARQGGGVGGALVTG